MYVDLEASEGRDKSIVLGRLGDQNGGLDCSLLLSYPLSKLNDKEIREGGKERRKEKTGRIPNFMSFPTYCFRL